MKLELPWFLSESRREWRAFLPLDPTGRGSRVAVVSKRTDGAGWVARIDAVLDSPAALSGPFATVEEAVNWAERRLEEAVGRR